MALRRVASRPTWLLSRAHQRAHGLLRTAFEAEGVRGYHFRVLAALEEYGASSQADIGRRTLIDRSDVVATIDDLVASGHVRRDSDPADGRRNLVTITRAGKVALERWDRVLTGVQEEVLQPLTAAERRTLVRLLEKIATPADGEGAW